MTQDLTPIELQPADAVPTEALLETFNRSFADYLIGPFQMDQAQWAASLARHGSELALSRVALRDGQLLAFALAAPRPRRQSWRLSAMGAVPAARGSGAAALLLRDFLARASQAGCARVELEVFAQNERARRLYASHGFEILDELHGYTGRIPAQPSAALRPLAWPEALQWLDEAEALGLDLPLQQSRQSLARVQGQQAWTLGSALLTGALAPGDTSRFHIGALIDRQAAQADARALLQALAARHAEVQTWFMPQLLRPSAGAAALAALGLQREPLHQLWMQRELAG